MRVLGIDTASRTNTIGLIDGDRVVADFAWDARDSSLQQIIVNSDLVLKRGGLSLEELDGLAVGIGPGSWTGVRVGVTVAKTLALAVRKPLCGISSLEALAHQSKAASALLCPLVDAGRETVYAAFYRVRGEALTREGEYYVGSITGLADRVREPALFLGRPAYLHRAAITSGLGPLARFGSPSDTPSGSVLALMSLPRFAAGQADDALSLVPLYLGESLAQALLRRKEAGAEGKGDWAPSS
jgi:tRNA threonylcarbamoyladenosine biosynthesis protein TsaB